MSGFDGLTMSGFDRLTMGGRFESSSAHPEPVEGRTIEYASPL